MIRRDIFKNYHRSVFLNQITMGIWILVCFVFAAMIVADSTAWAKNSYTTDFNNYYGKSGTNGGTASGSCATCHTGTNGSGGNLNSYAIDWLVNAKNFGSIETTDLDSDGFDNLAKILAESNPDDASSIPSVQDSPPVANASLDQTVNANALVTLDGSASYDPEGSAVTYTWSQTGGTTVNLSSRTAAKPTFTALQPAGNSETLTFTLTVSDGANTNTDTSSVTVNFVNAPPVADAGPTQTVNSNTQVTLDGSNSRDPDDGIAAYMWTQTSGPAVVLFSAGATQPTFISPDVGAGSASLNFSLTVTDGYGLSNTDTCIVNVTAGNLPPTPDAGTDQDVFEGDLVTLDGTGSNDPDGAITAYQWIQASGPDVILSNPASATPTFTAPALGTVGGSLSLQLTVTDDQGLQSTDTIIVNVAWMQLPPAANAGSDQTGAFSIEEGRTVVLDGTGSSDPDDGIASYLWEQTGTGTVVTLSDPTAAQPTFVAPRVDSGEIALTFRLTVTDVGGLQASGEVLVTVIDNGIFMFPDDVITTMTALGTPIAITEPVGGNITKLDVLDPSTLPADVDVPEDMVYGLIDFEIKTDTPGAKVTVVIYLPSPAPADYKWYKFNPATNVWTDYGEVTDPDGDIGVVFNTARDQMTLTLVDGGMGDDDEQSNGVIKDPSGLGAATANITTPTTSPGSLSNSFGSNAGGCFVFVSENGSVRQSLPATLVFLAAVFSLATPVVLRRLNRKK
jgi:hypothetical protein